jgi:hypothetical protein
MLRPTGQFWQERVRRVNDYERATFTATITAAYSDAVYDVEISATGARFYDVNNGTAFAFAAGDMVIVARVGGGRGNRHIIIAPAGRGALAPSQPGGGSGGSSGGSESSAEVIAARTSDVYGAKADLDARLEAGDAEVGAARQGYPSLSDRLDAKANLDSPQFTGPPRAEKVEIHDAATYVAHDGAGNLTLTDAAAGTKTLSDLAAGGAGADHNLLSATHPDTVAGAGSAGAIVRGSASGSWEAMPAGAAGQSLRVVRDASSGALQPRWTPSLESICEQMLHQVLSCQLDTKTAVKSPLTYTFTSGADANTGVVQTWSGTWANGSTYRGTNVIGDYFEWAFVGDELVMWSNTAHAPLTMCDRAATVYLNGALHGTWDQTAAASYTIGGLAYGVNVVKSVASHNGGTGADGMYIGELVPNQLPYQGLGVPGDEVEILHVSPWLYVTTIGTGPTDNGAVYPANWFGETITTRLPLSTDYSDDRVPMRNALDPGQPYASDNAGLVRLPIEFPLNVNGVSSGVASSIEPFPRAGLTISLGSGGASRGCRPADHYWHAFARSLDVAVIHLAYTPFIGRIVAAGNGSSLAPEDLVFGIAQGGSVVAETTNRSICRNFSTISVDLFKVPGVLL